MYESSVNVPVSTSGICHSPKFPTRTSMEGLGVVFQAGGYGYTTFIVTVAVNIFFVFYPLAFIVMLRGSPSCVV